MGKKIRIFNLFLGLLFLNIVSSTTVKAMYEQEEIQDGFYLEHRDECEDVNWTFIANGSIDRYKNPESKNVLKKSICKGERVRIQKMYQTPLEKWGLLFWSRDEEGNVTNMTGWVKLSDLEFVYDTNAFYMDHKNELVADRKGVSFKDIRDTIKQEVIVWSYPCSGEVVCRIDKEQYPTDNQIQNGLVYQDSKNRYWLLKLSCTYAVGTKWEGCAICLSDSTNAEIPAEDMKPYTTPDSDSIEAVNMRKKVMFLSVILLIILCICILGKNVWEKKGRRGREA